MDLVVRFESTQKESIDEKMETKGKKRAATRIRKVFNRKSQFGRSEAVQFARMGFFLNVTRRSSPVSPRFEPPLPPQPSFLPSFRSVQPRFARFRDSFVTKKLNSSRRDVHPPSLFPFSLALLSPSRPPFPSTVRVVSRPFSTALPAQFFGLATAPLSASFCTCQRQRLHTLDSSPASLSPLLNGVGRPIYLPGSKDQTANLSIERIAWLVISARSVAFHARIKMQSRPSPLSRSTIPPTHPFLLHDSYLPSNVCVFITVASGGQVDAREGRDRSSRSSHPRRASIEYRRQGRIRTWNLVRCFRWGRGDTLPSNNSSTASRLFTIDGIISSALKRAGGSVERFYLFFLFTSFNIQFLSLSVFSLAINQTVYLFLLSLLLYLFLYVIVG